MLLLLLACTTPATMFGCAQLFKQEPVQTSYETDTSIAPRDTIQLDIAMADRPGEDSLLGLLWDDVDEIGVLDVSKKRVLNANGFRVGVAGSSVPSALQSMLRESAKREATEAAWEKTVRSSVRRRSHSATSPATEVANDCALANNVCCSMVPTGWPALGFMGVEAPRWWAVN
jgi:hypothetical protein